MSTTRTSRQPRAKTKILGKAEDMLWKGGYAGTSVNDLVKAAGVSKGAFFHHFPSKDVLTSYILDTYAREELFGPLSRHLSEAHSAKNGLLDWVQDIYMKYEASGFRGGCMLGNFALELADQDEEAREQCKRLFLEWENIINTALKPEADTGKLLMEPRQLARLIITQLQGTLMTVKVHKDKNRAAREFMALAQLVEQLIKD